MWRYTSVWDMINIIKANSVSTVILLFIDYKYLGFSQASRSLLVIDFIICTGSVCVSRLGIRLFFSHLLKLLQANGMKTKKKRILLVGAGNSGQVVIQQTQHNFKMSISIVGIVDDNIDKIGRQIHGIPVICSVSNIVNLEIDFDEIYICIPSATSQQLKKIIVEECKKTNKPFKTLPSLSELVQGKISLNQFREVSIIDLLGREEFL